MFNGIIYKTGKIKVITRNKQSTLIGISTNLIFNKNDIGSSVSCNGVCLTLSEIKKKIIFFYISSETLKRSNFKYLKINQIINLERSLKYGKEISGHFIQGHVDTTAKIKCIEKVNGSYKITFSIAPSTNNFFRCAIQKF